jgi:hypothetical protein
VIVTRAALQGEGSPLDENAFLVRFDAYRDVYEIVAKQKFESGVFRGSMVITLDDLVKFAGERQQAPTTQALAA